MEACPYCRTSGRPSSRIRTEIQANCVKNRSGACVACGKLASIDRKIDEARRVLSHLLDEREELACILNDHHDPLTNRLPTEIATNIFLLCQPPQPNPMDVYSTYHTESLLPAVLNPGHICRTWRSISQNSPRLWSVICIDLTSKTCIRSIEVAQHWLRLSGSAPLYVRICATEGDSTIRPFALKLFALIATTAHRWEVLDLVISRSLIPSFSGILSQRHLHFLDILKLRCFGTFGDGVLRLNASPRIVVNDGDENPIVIGTERLVRFKLGTRDGLDLDRYIHLFSTARSLSTCTIRIALHEGDRPVGPRVEAPSLHTIDTQDVHGNFWDHFVFPRLQVLHLYRHTAWGSLGSLLRRSQCSITQLRLDVEKESLHVIVGLFEHLPDLKRLVLEFPGPCDFDFFSLLDSLASNNTRSFSKLASISCTVRDPLFDWSPLLVFLTNLTSRDDASLRSFVFYYELPEEGEGNWNEHNMPMPMDTNTMRLALDATRNLDEASIYDMQGTGICVLEEYRQRFEE